MGTQGRPLNYADIEDIENMLASINSADEAARIIALRTRRADDLVEADIIRIELARVWHILRLWRQRYERGNYGPRKAEEEGGNDAPTT